MVYVWCVVFVKPRHLLQQLALYVLYILYFVLHTHTGIHVISNERIIKPSCNPF